jgi:hypothetical protein
LPLLPVSGTEFALQDADGSSEMAVLEAAGSETASALALLSRTAGLAGQAPAEQPLRVLTITDFEFLLLTLRARWLGPRMTLGLACSACRELAQLQVDVAELLAQAAPLKPRDVAPHPTRLSWFTLESVAFRLPTVSDLLQTVGQPHPVRALVALTLDESQAPARVRGRIERAMSAMAPQLSRLIEGACPGCGAALAAYLSVPGTVVAELRLGAAHLHDEVDLIARNYHWPQAEILSLPLGRRRAYVERIRRALAPAA